MKIHVFSTGFMAATKELCLASVARQRCLAEVEHIYVEASQQSPLMGPMANLWYFLRREDPRTIVALLDGDDELARDDALQIVAEAYRDPDVWMTYGSLVSTDGTKLTPDYRTAVPDVGDVRGPECVSHLKTFYAGLAQHLDPAQDLRRPDGTWRDVFRDGALMYPLLELAGPKHRRFIPEVLVVYHDEASEARRASTEEKRGWDREIDEVRALPRKQPLSTLFGAAS